MQEYQTWYELLGHLVDTSQAKQRLASQLSVSTLTIARWLNHTSTPRIDTLRTILTLFPEHRQQFLRLFEQDNLHISDPEKETPSPDEAFPASNFYVHIFSIYRQIAPAIRSTTIQQLILTEIMHYLDPQKTAGYACTILLCLPPRQHKTVHSLYLAEGKGTNPWPQDMRQSCALLGAESLAGAVTTSSRSLLADRDQPLSLLPSRWSRHERSTFAAPIMRGLQIAGCLLVSTTQPASHLAQQQQRLSCYADLLLLSIEEDQWYDHDNIQLQLMPPAEVQEPYFAHLPQQIIARMVSDRTYTYPAMRQRLIQEIEETFTHTPTTSSYTPSPPR